MLSLKKFEPIAQSANGHLKNASQNTTLILGIAISALVLAMVAVVVAVANHG
jgi:hypothetical protein